MKNEKHIDKLSLILFIVSIVLCASDIFCYFYLLDLSTLYTILFVCANAIIIIGAVIFYVLKLKAWLKTAFIGALIVSVVSWAYFGFYATGLLSIFNSQEALQSAIESTGIWGMLVYTLLQFLQVTFIPLPAMLTTIIGTILFGPLVSSILSFIGIMLGSLFAFWLGDKFGEKIVVWIAGKEQTEKYSKLIYDKGKYLFFLMMLFPLFPDDILCLIAGMTAMPLKFFIRTIILTRPIGIVMTCYLGSGEIIPFSGWGLAVWGIIILVMIAMFYCSYKYKDQIEAFIGKLASKLNKKAKTQLVNDNAVEQQNNSVLKENSAQNQETIQVINKKDDKIE